MLVFGEDETLAKWAGDRIGISHFGPCTTIGVSHKGQIVAVALFNHYQHPSIEITFVTSSPRWASPGAVRTILRYPFNQLRCKRVTATVRSKNEPAIKFLVRLGFCKEGYHPDAFEDDDAISYGLLRRDAVRWLE